MKDMKTLCDMITNIKKPSSAINAVSLLKSVEIFTDCSLALVIFGLGLKQKDFKIDEDFFNVRAINEWSGGDAFIFEKAMEAAIYYTEIVKEGRAFRDILTEIYETLYLSGKSGDGLGQFLTPMDVSDLIAKLASTKKGKSLVNDISINDDCCGTASMPLSALRETVKETQLYINKKVSLNDIDPLMVKMAIIQVMAPVAFKEYDLKEVSIYCGNMLLNNPRSVFQYKYKVKEKDERQAEAFNKILDITY